MCASAQRCDHDDFRTISVGQWDDVQARGKPGLMRRSSTRVWFARAQKSQRVAAFSYRQPRAQQRQIEANLPSAGAPLKVGVAFAARDARNYYSRAAGTTIYRLWNMPKVPGKVLASVQAPEPILS
jgi:hypothetical protein